MADAVVVSYARTGLAKSVRGGFNMTHGAAMGGHAVKHAMARAKIDPAEVEDVVMGCGNPEGATGHNTGRDAALWAGCPVTTSGTTINRFCSSGLNSIAVAANYIRSDGAKVAVGAGVESISLVQNGHMNGFMANDPWLDEHVPELRTSMLETAEIVAERYGVSRAAQDDYALQSQQRTAQAQAEGRFDAEIAPMTTVMKVLVDKQTGESADKEIYCAEQERDVDTFARSNTGISESQRHGSLAQTPAGNRDRQHGDQHHRRDQQEVRGDPLGGGSGLAQQAGGAVVLELALAGRQVVVDGVADQRVDEPQRRLLPQDLDPGQLAGGAGDHRLTWTSPARSTGTSLATSCRSPHRRFWTSRNSRAFRFRMSVSSPARHLAETRPSRRRSAICPLARPMPSLRFFAACPP